MSRDQHRKSPSGLNLDNLILYDKDGVAYRADTLQIVAIKIESDPDDSENAILDGRAQYYTKGDVTSLESATAKDLNICQTTEALGGDVTVFDLSKAGNQEQFVLMGLRVTLVERVTSGGAMSYTKLDDLVFGVYNESGAYYLTDTAGTSDSGATPSLSLVGNDTTALSVTYTINVSSGGLSVEMTPPTSTETLTAYAELFIYEAKDV